MVRAVELQGNGQARMIHFTPRALRFFFTGPLSHFFYLFMEHWIPPEVPLAGVKRLLLDRLVFAPAFLLVFFFVMNFLEVGSISSSYNRPSFSTGIWGWNSEGLWTWHWPQIEVSYFPV